VQILDRDEPAVGFNVDRLLPRPIISALLNVTDEFDSNAVQL